MCVWGGGVQVCVRACVDRTLGYMNTKVKSSPQKLIPNRENTENGKWYDLRKQLLICGAYYQTALCVCVCVCVCGWVCGWV